MINAIVAEINSRVTELTETVYSVYFGGGTPSVLRIDALQKLIAALHDNFEIADKFEFTIEVNPDDLTKEYLSDLKNIGINRLSIGVQSFVESHLQFMNRSHNAQQALQSINWANQMGFEISSIDLIYGFELLSEKQWKENLNIAMKSGLQHLSCYALTIEEKTPFHKIIAKTNKNIVDDQIAKNHFDILNETALKNHWNHYEISNLAKENNFSIHNTAYWKSKAYLGIGPGAHSFDGINTRRWNISDNLKYIDSIENKISYFEEEKLTNLQLNNEQIMVGLRTAKGIKNSLVAEQLQNKNHKIHRFIENGFAKIDADYLSLSKEGWWISNHIIEELFVV